MNIEKSVVVARLRERNQNARADFVEKELPDSIDPDKHGGLLATLNLNVADLVASAPAGATERTS
jgi:hypothetical protein